MDLRLKGNWNIIKGKLKEKYGELTDDDLNYIEGHEDQLIGALQKRLDKKKTEVIEELESMVEDK
jgi:uncharacterized protein YjbJ (UPF0337 family)